MPRPARGVDANEGGTPGDIRLLRTGDQTGALMLQFQIDETVSNAAQYGSGLEYIGPDINASVDGILYGEATFVAGDNTIDASAGTDNAQNPTVNFELLPESFAIPGAALPDVGIISTTYNVGTPSTATPVIRDSLALKNASATIGNEELAADHNTIIPAEAILAKAPPGVTIAYTITGGNSAGMFVLTSNGTLELTKDASQATSPTVYAIQIQAIGTFADGTHTNTSTCEEDVTIGPEIGVYGSTIAVRGTSDAIDLTFDRFTTNDDLPLTVNFTINWGNLSASDLYGDEVSYNALTSGQIVIPANQATVSMVLYAPAFVTGDPPIGKFYIALQPSSDANATYATEYDPDLETEANTHLLDANADSVLPRETLYVLDGLTAFAAYNPSSALLDKVSSPNPGISPNDVLQQGLGDCYFMTAEAALAQSSPMAIVSLITSNADGTFTVKLYNDRSKNWPGGKDADGNEIAGWVTFTTSGGDFLSNGYSMAGLSGDYVDSRTAPNYGAVEVWPQLLKWAWVQLAGCGSYQAVWSGSPSDALTALTGLKFGYTGLARMSNQEIGALLQQAINTGEPVSLGTYGDAQGKNGAFSLGPENGNVHYNHAYYVNSINTDEFDNVLSVVLINPWGVSSDDYRVTVPIDEFSALFADIFYYLP
ncbi:MAG TPA: C2 family cysteine protease [Pirellulales bacterium]|nr:C2 family cysteine protease [Pirellulales bacterium]